MDKEEYKIRLIVICNWEVLSCAYLKYFESITYDWIIINIIPRIPYPSIPSTG